MAMTNTHLKALKPADRPTKVSDGGGLHVLVTPKGSKLWRLAYRFGGKQKLLALGSYPAVGLADARAKREDAKRLLAEGVDPSEQAKIDKREKQDSNANTFRAIADALLSKNEKEGKAVTTLNKKRWLVDMACAHFGERPIIEIMPADIMVVLKQVEAKGQYETARRLRAVIGQVFRYAIAHSQATYEPTFGLRGALIVPKVTHRAAITDQDTFAKLVQSIWAYGGNIQTCTALKLMCLLYPRPGELRQAEWVEFDFDKAVWTIPASRTKMRRELKKPLPPLAVSILRDLQRHTGNRRLVFPSIQSPEKPLSENTMNQALRRMGYGPDEATSHGFRASASTLLNESGKWQADAIEAELGHADRNAIRATYHRAIYWDEREKMANWWAGAVESMWNLA